MRIALLTDGIMPHVIGGMQRHSFYLTRYLARAGHEVDLYHARPPDPTVGDLDAFDEVERRNIRSFVVESPHAVRLPGHYVRASHEYSRRIRARLRENARADFIYAKGFAGWALLEAKVQGETLPPIGVNLHGYEMFQPTASLRSWLESRLLLRSPARFVMDHADFVFSYGGRITSLLLDRGVPRAKIIEIPGAVEPAWIVTDPPIHAGPLRFLFVGRHERRKGIDELNAVLERLPCDDTPPFEFHFVGPIPTQERIVDARIRYHGLVRDDAELRRLHATADVVVCPSRSEGMPNVLLEGMASGLAPIATDTGATALLVDDENGWLIAPGARPELERALRAALALDATALRRKRSAAIRKVREGFTWPAIAARTADAIRARIAVHP